MPISTTDLAILFVSLAACGYCFLLSRRLHALQNTKEGLGATITALSESIANMSSIGEQTRARTGHAAAELSQLLTQTAAAKIALEDLLAEAERQKQGNVVTWKLAHQQVEQSMVDLLDQCRKQIASLAAALKQIEAARQSFERNGAPLPHARPSPDAGAAEAAPR